MQHAVPDEAVRVFGVKVTNLLALMSLLIGIFAPTQPWALGVVGLNIVICTYLFPKKDALDPVDEP